MAEEPQQRTVDRSSSTSGGEYRPRSGGPSSGGRPQRRSFNRGDNNGRRGRYQPRRKVCIFCAKKDLKINWKRADDLRRYIGDSGGLFPRRKTGLCARHQRRVAVAVKRARHLALLPYTSEHIRVMSQKNS
jgi:small subunit ribosomal protein S18